MAATQERSSSATKGADGGISLEMKMLIPVLALLAVLSLFPFFYIIWMSLNIVSLINGISFDFAGLANWTRMFTDEVVGAAWARAALYFVATVGLEMILGIAIALLVHELVWGKNLVLSLILLPMFMAPVIVGLLGRFLTDSSYGLYAYVLRELGIFESDTGDRLLGLAGRDPDGCLGVDALDSPDRARWARLGEPVRDRSSQWTGPTTWSGCATSWPPP